MQPPPQIQPPNVSGYANTPYSRSSHSWHDGCLPEGYPDLFSSAHLPPRLLSKGPSIKYVTLFRPRAFVKAFFVWKVLSGMVFVRSSSVRIHLLHQKVKHHFKFLVSYV